MRGRRTIRTSIPDFDTAALLVYLDIFRGVPTGTPDEFVFGADRLMARSAFSRMLARAQGADMEDVKKIERSPDGIS